MENEHITKNERESLERIRLLVVKKIDVERAVLKHGIPPGIPTGIRYIAGETRMARLLSWQEELLHIERQIALYISDMEMPDDLPADDTE